ncbi:sialoadhesin [Etheostoma spectabile]|uniref:sialoadhesin n=1 Tax=Etheostoma spectabile TaxID=54343 RepID=UPI0013AF51F6|nr:sialoadhesin-like [Etheostoma spectabile]
MTQLSSTASTCAARWKMWLVKVFSVTYFTAVCAAQVPQNVPPTPTLKLLSPWLDVFENESVMLSCELDSDDWKFTWYKNQNKVQYDDEQNLEEDQSSLNITSVTRSHQGGYACKALPEENSGNSTEFSNIVNVTVYEKTPKPRVSKVPDFNPMYVGETVNFTCKVHVSSGWEYQWYKDGNKLRDTSETISIHLGLAHKGEYWCKATRGETTSTDISAKIQLNILEIPVPSLKLATPWLDVFPTESVKLSCGMDGTSDWTYTWDKDGQQVRADIVASFDSNGATLSISSASAAHAGQYNCKGHLKDRSLSSSSSSGLTLKVYDKKPTVILTQYPEYKVMFPGEPVSFSCHINVSTGWEYLWYKDSTTLTGSANKYPISSVGITDGGSYTCTAKRGSGKEFLSVSSQPVHLEVEDTKPRVTLMQNPLHNVMHTGDSVSFSCHINVSSGWEYLWYKDSNPLAVSGNNHTISSVVRTNTGSYQCKVKRGRDTVFFSDQSQAVRLDIEERPLAEIILVTGWSEVFSTDSLVLKCRVQESQDTWNYTWFKEEQPINLLSEKHTVTPENNPEQSEYSCRGIRTGRPSYSKPSDSFKTKNLLLKRRVLLSISGCIFFGIIAIFIGCIVLRVIRKPGNGEDRPEETELFLTMAQLKDHENTPCPLVQYITDAELNASSKKEAGENGTISGDTTPLPISSQEDQAMTSESHDTTENNGGLVSFKQ